MDITFAVVTTSDTRSIEQDSAGQALCDLIKARGWHVVSHVIVHDEVGEITPAIKKAVDELGADVVLTCGGTGISPRDVTPEATMAACDRSVPGVAEAIRAASLAKTSHAMLSRAVCMMRGRALVINFPGSERAARECWDVIADEMEHAQRMIAGEHHHDHDHDHGHGHDGEAHEG